MTLFTCSFDKRNSIQPFVLRCLSRNTEADVTIKILGQEKNDDILFCFSEVSNTNESPPAKNAHAFRTYVGVYSSSTDACKVVFTTEGLADIVSCTITQCHSLLIYTEYIPSASAARTTSGRQSRGRYKMFLVEIFNVRQQKFSLNLDRPSYVSAQFLSCQECEVSHHALIFLHAESIGKYQFMRSSNGKGHQQGHNLTQPHKVHMFKEHIWYQWDSLAQSLFVLHVPSSRLLHKATSAFPHMKCYQLNSNGSHHEVFDLPVDISADLSDLSTKYDHELLSGPVPDRSMNMQVLTQASSGVVCICWQVLHPKTRLRASSGVDRQQQSVEYSVYSATHGQTINVTVPKVLKKARQHRVHFSMHRDYVLVYLPGCFVHLLDVNLHSEPTHHVICQSSISHSFSGDGRRLSNIRMELASQLGDVSIFDAHEGRAYILHLSLDYLLEVFSTCYTLELRLSIMRYVILHLKSRVRIQKMLSLIKEDIASPETTRLLMEYIVCAAHATMCNLHGSIGCSLLPYSADAEDCDRGSRFNPLIVKSSSRDETPVRIHVEPTPKELVAAIPYPEQSKVEISACWHSLAVYCKQRKALPKRFTTTSIFANVTSSLPLDETEQRMEAIVGNLADAMSDVSILNSDSSTKNLGNEYMAVVLKELQQLYTSLCKLFDFEEDALFDRIQDRSSADMTQVAADKISKLRTIKKLGSVFEMLERYRQSVAQLGLPLLKGFNTFFTTVGYNTLSKRLFLQYVDAGILALTEPFIRRLLSDSKLRNQTQFVMQCISRLPREDALACCWLLDNPSGMQFAAEEAVAYSIRSEAKDGTDDALFTSLEIPISYQVDKVVEREGTELLTRTPALAQLMQKLSASGVCTLSDEILLENAAFYFTKTSSL